MLFRSEDGKVLVAARIAPDVPGVISPNTPCSQLVQSQLDQAPQCFDTKFKNVTTTYVQDVNVKSMRYNPAQGLNLMAGLRYVFGKAKPAPDPVVEEVVIEEVIQQPAVRGLW